MLVHSPVSWGGCVGRALEVEGTVVEELIMLLAQPQGHLWRNTCRIGGGLCCSYKQNISPKVAYSTTDFCNHIQVTCKFSTHVYTSIKQCVTTPHLCHWRSHNFTDHVSTGTGVNGDIHIQGKASGWGYYKGTCNNELTTCRSLQWFFIKPHGVFVLRFSLPFLLRAEKILFWLNFPKRSHMGLMYFCAGAQECWRYFNLWVSDVHNVKYLPDGSEDFFTNIGKVMTIWIFIDINLGHSGELSSFLLTSHSYQDRRQEMMLPKQPRGIQSLLNFTTSGTILEEDGIYIGQLFHQEWVATSTSSDIYPSCYQSQQKVVVTLCLADSL